MPLRLLPCAPAALLILSGAALAQDDPRTVGVSVDGDVVEVPVDLAARACGVDAETLLAEWEALGTDLSTMADTSVQADATDLAPEVAVDTPMDSAIDGQTVADGADATHGTGGEAAPDVASDATVSGVTPTAAEALPEEGTMDAGTEATADAATEAEVAAAGTGEAAGGPATPTAGTTLSKSAVCEVSGDAADSLGIAVPG